MTTTRGRTDWREAGACAHADPDLFFPVSSTGRALGQIAKAKAICAGCPVVLARLDRGSGPPGADLIDLTEPGEALEFLTGLALTPRGWGRWAAWRVWGGSS